MILLAFANAALRELVIVKHFADLAAHQLSTLTLVVLCTVYTGFIFPFLRIENKKQALKVGLLWMILVVAFEFSLGLIANRNWRSLLADYNILAGRIWPVFLLWILLLPLFNFLVRKAKPVNTTI
jgi:hypothetical protein